MSNHSYYSQQEAAEYVGMAPGTLSILCNQGDGPRGHKLGNARSSRLVYRRTALDHWIKLRERQRIEHQKAKAAEKTRKAREAAAAHEYLKARVTVLLHTTPGFNGRNTGAILKAHGYRRLRDVPASEHEEIYTEFVALAETLKSGEAV